MSTVNGIGTRFFGRAEPRRDGSYLATQWFCLVIPLIPLGSFRLWPEGQASHGLGTYSSSAFRIKPQGLYLPHVGKMYGLYLAIYLFMVIADRIGSGEWRFG